MVKLLVALFVCVVFSQSVSFGWGKRGHEITASVAARILESKKNAGYLRSHEFDLGYYSNVPDIIWRNLNTPESKDEGFQHFIDWNKTFEAIFGSPKNLPIEFADYKAKLGDNYKLNLGVVPYRIHGLIKRCKSIAANLTKEKQGPLLVCIGTLSHYTGDLSMPLHVTDNFDGQMTGQTGVHAYFETDMVDALDPSLKKEVMEQAIKSFDKSEVQKMDGDAAIRWLIADSYGRIDELLMIDKHIDRKNINASKEKFKALIIQRLVRGAIVTAQVWSEILAPVHSFDDTKFLLFRWQTQLRRTRKGRG